MFEWLVKELDERQKVITQELDHANDDKALVIGASTH